MSRIIISQIEAFVSDDAGATSIEYALIAVIVSLACVVGLTGARDELQAIFYNAAAALASNTSN